jgi:hypothetical protein
MNKSTNRPSRTQKLKKVAKTLSSDYGPVGIIVGLAKKGFSRQEIIAAGFNKSTVYRQVREYVGPVKH